MQSNYEALRDCPEIMSKEQFRIVCHISKHTAYYLIHSGILPCEITGKKTHKYFIKRSDVLELLKKFDKNPYIVVPPKGWYKKAKRPLRIDGVRLYPPRLPTERKRKSYYTNKLKSRKDVLDVPAISQITGYSRQSIEKWLRSGKLKSIMNSPKYYVPKTYLIDFLAGEDYMDIAKKSDTHLKDLWEMYYSIGKMHKNGLYY